MNQKKASDFFEELLLDIDYPLNFKEIQAFLLGLFLMDPTKPDEVILGFFNDLKEDGYHFPNHSTEEKFINHLSAFFKEIKKNISNKKIDFFKSVADKNEIEGKEVFKILDTHLDIIVHFLHGFKAGLSEEKSANQKFIDFIARLDIFIDESEELMAGYEEYENFAESHAQLALNILKENQEILEHFFLDYFQQKS